MESYTALLRTACGCEKLIRMKGPNPQRYIEVALMQPIKDFSKENATIKLRYRLFSLFVRIGPETFEYREELE